MEILKLKNNLKLAIEYCDDWLKDNIYETKAYVLKVDLLKYNEKPDPAIQCCDDWSKKNPLDVEAAH